MTLEELMGEMDKLTPEERGRLQDYLDEKALEETVGRRIAEIEADPSIMIPGDEVMRELRELNAKRREERLHHTSGSP